MDKKTKSPAEILQEIALKYNYFYEKGGKTFVEIELDEENKVISVQSQEFRSFLRYQLYLKKKTISEDGLNSLILLLCARAQYEAEEIETAERIGKNKGIFYYDLANANGECIKITSEGYKFVQKSPMVFIRSKSLLEQIEPKCGYGIDVWDLRKYFNVERHDDFILLLIHVLSCLIPEIPHHILIFLGNQGSAKSTASKLVKRLVDPSTVDISTIPKSKEDLILQLSSEYLTVYDNINTLNTEYSNIFCQVSTGGNFVKRALYTDGELAVYSFKRCLILNGISYLTTQSDLLDRSIVITLKKISDSERKTEKEIFSSFENELPYIMHSIFQTISSAKKIHKTLEVQSLPRMADAVKWQCAISEALGIDHERFLEIYHNNQECVNEEILSANPVSYAIMLFMGKKVSWTGSVTKLWEKLDNVATLKKINKSDPLWAKSPSSLSRQLNLLKINLEKVGISFNIKNIGQHKEIILKNE